MHLRNVWHNPSRSNPLVVQSPPSFLPEHNLVLSVAFTHNSQGLMASDQGERLRERVVVQSLVVQSSRGTIPSILPAKAQSFSLSGLLTAQGGADYAHGQGEG